MKFYTYLSLIGACQASASEDEAYTSSYEDCLAFAATFDNTCTDLTTHRNFLNVDEATVTCDQSGAMSQATCPAHGTK